MISDQDKERVRQATDFVQLVSETVELKQRGQDFWGRCPFHNERSASFHINPQTGWWKCFGCERGGDIFSYIGYRENLEFADSVRYLAERAGIELEEEKSYTRGPKRRRLTECLEEAQNYYQTMLLRGKDHAAAEARSYLSSRGFGQDICKRWKLGFAPGHTGLVNHLKEKGFNTDEILGADLALMRSGHLADRFYDRVMFPIHNEQGKCIGFGGRVLGDAKPKYLNTKETAVFHKSKHMFAFDYAKESITAQNQAIIVEGYTDVIALHEAGFTNTVATLGTALSEDHIRLLGRFAQTIICMFDGDEAGQKAAESAVQYLGITEAELMCVILPDNLDPAEFIEQKGPDALTAQLARATRLIDFVFETKVRNAHATTETQKMTVVDEMAKILAPLKTRTKDNPLLDSYIERLAEELWHKPSYKQTIKKRFEQARPSTQPSTSQGSGGSVSSQAASASTKNSSSLPQDVRKQRILERELLSFLVTRPDLTRAYQDRLASFEWSDSRIEAMAWAMLATPPSATSEELVDVATEVYPKARNFLADAEDAARILSQDLSTDELQRTIQSYVDAVDYSSTMSKLSRLRTRLAHPTETDNVNDLLREANELNKYARYLQSRISGESE